MIIAAKLVCLVIWMGAATSKLNKHFPFVISTMMSNNPVFRPRCIKRKFFEHFPDDLRPGRLSRWLAHFSTAIEGLVPLVLFFSHGGWPTAIAAFVMLCFHFGILSSIPMGVPLEWNVFMMFSVLALFVGHAQVGLADMTTPLPVVLFVVVAGTVVRRKPVPAQGVVPARHAVLRRQLGHHAVVRQAVGRRRRSPKDIVAIASMPQAQMERFYGSPETAQMYLYMGYAFRAFNTHGRAMFTLAHRAMAGQNEDDYVLTDGERICSDRHRLELRRRPHAQRAVDRRDAGALPLRARGGAGRAARRAAHPQADARSTGSSTPPPASSNAATSKSPTW